MPSAFLWPMSVPSALRAPAPVNQGVRRQALFRTSSNHGLLKIQLARIRDAVCSIANGFWLYAPEAGST